MLQHSDLNMIKHEFKQCFQARNISFPLIWINQSPFAAISSFSIRLHNKTIVATLTSAIKTLIIKTKHDNCRDDFSTFIFFGCQPYISSSELL